MGVVPSQTSSSSLDHGTELQGRSPKALPPDGEHNSVVVGIRRADLLFPHTNGVEQQQGDPSAEVLHQLMKGDWGHLTNDEGHNVTVNGDRYRAMITNFFIPELNTHDIQELWFQQDGATCHTARATIDLLKDTFGDRLISRFGPVNWPPRS
ncbi:hypothetical protein TNCV_3752791 [Trichonephila clavipes]|nr:hypothetical protein TNCV_3752791 [Trichonephila clavipes]